MSGLSLPVWLELGPWRLHPHLVFELLAYMVGFQLFLWLRRRQADPFGPGVRWPLVAAAVVGAALGSKVLAWLIDLEATWVYLHDPVYLMGGKTIVGGLAGGLIAVEWTKRRMGVTRATGDLYALPLAIGIAIGRIGCFLTGITDRTHGVVTAVPWAIDHGDGLLRHPTALYEVGFLVALAAFLLLVQRRGRLAEGSLFRMFMVAYFGYRFLMSFLQPFPTYFGLATLQWAALLVLAHYALGAWRRHRATRPETGIRQTATFGTSAADSSAPPQATPAGDEAAPVKTVASRPAARMTTSLAPERW